VPLMDPEVRRKAMARQAIVRPLLGLRGFSVSTWAVKAGVSPSPANDYFHGRCDLPPEIRAALANALGVGAADIPE
jgi:hypothetical protein